MRYLKDINPFFEAYVYLSQRFTDERASERIRIALQEHSNIHKKYLEYYNRIIDLEKKLDAEFKTDEVMQTYFTPLATKETVEGRNSITIGGILLRMPEDGPLPCSIAELEDYYSAADISSRYRHFGGVLNAFKACKSDINDLAGLFTAIEGIIASSEDKWFIIDAVTDPVSHLEKLKPLVSAVAERISEVVCDFSELLDDCYGLISTADKRKLDRLISLNEETNYKDISIVPSLFCFNLYIWGTYENDKLLITLGVFTYRIFMKNADAEGDEKFIYMLKVLSDATRLRVLHSLCDEYSYGQKLAEQYKSTPNALYYHLDKLSSCGLVEIRETEYRTLYTMNKHTVYHGLTNLRDYLVNGWKPEDEEEQ
ncbi:MAG: winged helix-turn-helix transcriptional regulator [Clostridia bacterium]|nr:winged helix-turn-helix transcriptional regulator [Clostridia bacterium]